ncbi:telomeric repeat-binding factor 2 isoform X2 [Tiliqua scincoides]|uniref:telomeric repeat-binding factor 2 isoform X2 n=1 Tax=Tiliqua scincoides TaxID=71010 RepID=UPI0034630E3B
MAGARGKLASRSSGRKGRRAPPVMAASPGEAAAEAREKALEEAVNRWALLFYFHRALQAFRAGRSRDFRQLRDVINAVLARPLAIEKSIHLQLRIIQLLSRLEEDWTIDTETELTPLECALALVEKMKKELDIDVGVIEEMRKSIKEAAVIACVKNKEFEQASKILRRHMSKDPSTQKFRSELQNVIREKNFSHPAIWNFSYKAFQQRMLLFFEDYLDNAEPFLLEMARRDLADQVETRLSPLGAVSEETMVSESGQEVAESLAAPPETLMEQVPEEGPSDRMEEKTQSLEGAIEEAANPTSAAGAGDTAAISELKEAACRSAMASSERAGRVVAPAGLSESGEQPPAPVPGTSKDTDGCLPRRPTCHGISALREAFKSLSDAPDPDAAFSELDETDWMCPKGSSASVSHGVKRKREEEKAKERATSLASPLFRKTKCLVTISRLVMGPEKACRCDPHANPVSPKEPVVAITVKPTRQKPPTRPASPRFPRLAKERLNSSMGHEEKDEWSDEDELFLVDQRSKGRHSSSSSIAGSRKKIWTLEESTWIKSGVQKFGEGNWKAIFKAFPFKGRTPVMIKDRWRTMKKLGLQ